MEQNRRLIDANALYNQAHSGLYSAFHCSLANLTDLKRLIDDAPTVDAVEVVRCRNCESYHPYGGNTDGLVTWGKCLKIEMDVDMPSNGYCCFGERRDNGKKEMA